MAFLKMLAFAAVQPAKWLSLSGDFKEVEDRQRDHQPRANPLPGTGL